MSSWTTRRRARRREDCSSAAPRAPTRTAGSSAAKRSSSATSRSRRHVERLAHWWGTNIFCRGFPAVQSKERSVFDEPRVEAARPKRSNRVHFAKAEQPIQRVYWTASTLGRVTVRVGRRSTRIEIGGVLFRLPPEPFADAGRGVNHEVDHCRRRHEFS
jgi:hypothetical protein